MTPKERIQMTDNLAIALKAANQKATGLSRKLHEHYENGALLESQFRRAWAEVKRLEMLGAPRGAIRKA